MSNQSLGCSVFAVSLPMQLGVTTIINYLRSLAKSYLRLLNDSGKLLVGVSSPPKGRVIMMTMIINDNDC